MRACRRAQHRPSVNKHAIMTRTTQMSALWLERLNQPQLVKSQTMAAKKAMPKTTPTVPKERQVECKKNSHSANKPIPTTNCSGSRWGKWPAIQPTNEYPVGLNVATTKMSDARKRPITPPMLKFRMQLSARCWARLPLVESGDGVHRSFRFGAVGHRGSVIETIIVVVADYLEYHSVATRDESNAFVDQPIIDVRLRNHARQLSAHGCDGFIAEQSARAVACGVDQNFFPQFGEVRRRVKFRDLYLSPIGEKVPHEQPGIGRDVEHHQRIAPQIVPAQTVTAGCEVLAARYQIGDQLALQLGELRPRIVLQAAAAQARRVIGDVVAVDEFHRISRQTEQGLVCLKRSAGHVRPQLLELRRRVVLEANARIRCPQTRGER